MMPTSRALGRLLRSADNDVRLFAFSPEFLALHDPFVHGCVVLDLAIPDMSGLEVQAALARSGSHLPLIFLSRNGSIAASVDAMRAGALTFLTKPVEPHALFAAIEEALRIDTTLRRETILHSAALGRFATLTPRERQVLSRVVAGRPNKQIAADLGTVVKTIKVHRAPVLQRMGARSLAQLVRIAASLGITGDSTSDPVMVAPRTQLPRTRLAGRDALYCAKRSPPSQQPTSLGNG